MRQTQVPTCYFPTTVLFIDDSRDFLLNFTLILDDDIAYTIENSIEEALKTINQTTRPIPQSHLTENMESHGCPITSSAINLDLASIHQEIYNPQRFEELSVVVVDYDMPNMNGLEVCRRMETSSAKRILLTGRADEKIAVRAFNDGLIDMFVQKQALDTPGIISQHIKNMQLRYFQSTSDVVNKMLSISSPSCLQDPAFIKVFNDYVQENGIVEYYLTETSGSFLMLDADANPSYFIVKTQQDLGLHHEMAIDNKAPQAVLDQIEKGEKIPFFWDADDYFSMDWNDWASYLYPAKKIEGHEPYYYACVKKTISSNIQPNNILSYKRFLKQKNLT